MKSTPRIPHAPRRAASSHPGPWWSRWLACLRRWPTRATLPMLVTVTVAAPAVPKPNPTPTAHACPAASEPVVRSVPVPIEALAQLLNAHPTARARLRHLALVESSCRLSPGDPFGRLPPRVIEIAVRQLDAVLARQPSLRVLRLQLERHLQSRQARIAATLAAEDRRWQLDGAVTATGTTLFPDSMIGAPWGITDFQETRPLDRMPSNPKMAPEPSLVAASAIPSWYGRPVQ